MPHQLVNANKYSDIELTEKSIQEVIVEVEPTNVKQLHTKTHRQDGQNERPPQSIWMLAYCFIGIMLSFTLNGLVLEQMTTHRTLGEMSLTFVFCFFYSIVALALRFINKEKPSTMPQSKLMLVGLLAFGSTISSMIALRYVTFITRILGKSCKSIPVMLVGLFLGKSYAIKKYLSVLVLSAGVAVFLLGTAHEKQHNAVKHNHEHEHEEDGRMPNMVLGSSLLLLSLLFDGATGALEDRYLEKYRIGAFDLMYVVNIWKCFFAAMGMVCMGEVSIFLEKATPALPNLVMLSATGALGQAFIFFTISKFGALTTSIIGTCRKVLSIVLSVLLFGHILSMEQLIGLSVAFLGIGLNWIRIQMCEKKPCALIVDDELILKEKHAETEELLEGSEDTVSSEEEDDLSPTNSISNHTVLLKMQGNDQGLRSLDVDRGLELVNTWHRQQHTHTAASAV